MKFKYTGSVPAVLFQNDKLVDILPGEIVDFLSAPSSHFIKIDSPTSKKEETLPKKKAVIPTALDAEDEKLIDSHLIQSGGAEFALRKVVDVPEKEYIDAP